MRTGAVASTSVEDNMDAALTALNLKFSSPTIEIAKGLMNKEGP
jgi:hypothetical protein